MPAACGRALRRPGCSGFQTLGYAAPGTVVAIGVLIVLATFDGFIDRTASAWFGVSTGLLFIGSGAALLYAYTVRFLAISAGGIDAGLQRIPMSFDHASRVLGQSAGGTFRHVHLPLSKAAITAAGLLVFVDLRQGTAGDPAAAAAQRRDIRHTSLRRGRKGHL